MTTPASLPPLVNPMQYPDIDAAALDAACRAVRDYCRWHIAPVVTETRTVDGPGGNLLVLPTLRLTGLSDVTSDGAVVDDPEWSESGLVRGSWSRKFRGVTVTMEHGYDDCPESVLGVVLSMSARGAAGPGANMTVAGPFTMMYGVVAQGGAVALLDAHKTALDPYRLPGLA